MYYEFIEKCKQRILEENIYTEKHHIIPRCMGGKDEDENLIVLTAQEHYEAHKLLALENPEHSGLQIAWWNMCHCQSYGREYIVSAEEYAEAKARSAKIFAEKYKGRPGTTNGMHNPIWGAYRKQPIIVCETNERFECILDAAKFYNVSEGSIRDSLNNEHCTCKGLHFRRENDTKYNPQSKRIVNRKKIKNLETGEVFESATAAAKSINGDVSSLLKCIKANRKYKNIRWEEIYA